MATSALRYLTSLFIGLTVLTVAGCASTRTQESMGEYVDDSVITAKVKTAIINDPTLSAAEINVETFKGVVQLSGFVSSSADQTRAVEVARKVGGVKAVRNDMRTK